MTERSFDEMIAYFNRRVAEMDIAQNYKMELLGMVTAIGYKHEQTAQRWTPCSKRLPKVRTDVLLMFEDNMAVGFYSHGDWNVNTGNNLYVGILPSEEAPVAWMHLPEPYREEPCATE